MGIMRQWTTWWQRRRLKERALLSDPAESPVPPAAGPEALDEGSDEEEEKPAVARRGRVTQPLTRPPAARWHLAWKTDVGLLRNHNEDTLVVFLGRQEGLLNALSFGLCIVADGMGGHQAGEQASALASRLVAGYWLEKIYLPLLYGDWEEETVAPTPELLTEVVQTALAQANESVMAHFPGSGTTLTGALLLGDQVWIGHVGDSRAYLLSPGQGWQQLTADHSLVHRLVELGQLSPEEAGSHPQRNVLYQAVGQGAPLEVEVVSRTMHPGERLLLCSDGLWEMVDEATLQQLVAETVSLQEVCDRLVAAANEAGGADNITVTLAELVNG